MTGILIPEEQGGSGLALLDAALVSQSLGHAVTPTPFLSAVMVPVALAGAPKARSERLAGGIAGRRARLRRRGDRELLDPRGRRRRASRAGVLSRQGDDGDRRCGTPRIRPAARGRRRSARGDSRRRPGLESTQARHHRRHALHLGAVCSTASSPRPSSSDGEATRSRACSMAGRIALAADSLGACESMIEQAVAYAQASASSSSA